MSMNWLTEENVENFRSLATVVERLKIILIVDKRLR